MIRMTDCRQCKHYTIDKNRYNIRIYCDRTHITRMMNSLDCQYYEERIKWTLNR